MEVLAKDATGDPLPMLCLSDRIRQEDPSGQELLNTIAKAQTRTPLILAVWPFARVLARHSVA